MIGFEEAIKLLKIRGKAMQSAVPKNEGGMVAVLGSDINTIEDLIKKKIINALLQTIIAQVN